ncbi:MAG: hypothetical protein AB7K24_07545 [Gemmataceae bacterium]
MNRDAWVKTLFPAIVVLLGYGLYFVNYSRPAREAVEKDLRAATDKAPPANQLNVFNKELRELNRQIKEIQANLDEARNAWQALLGRCADPTSRNQRLERITHLLDRHQLQFMDDSDVDVNKEKQALDHLEKMVSKMEEIAPGPKPRMRQIRFQGRYDKVQNLIEELGRGPVLALPVGISMKEATLNTDWREWTLIVWM